MNNSIFNDYQSKIAALEETSSKDWWKHMKNLMGAPSSNTNEMQGLANKCTEGDMTQLVNSMNDFFVSVSADLPRLDPARRVFDIDKPLPPEFTIEAASNQRALQKVKGRKATGPDNIPTNPFGFKAKHSTDMTIYALKEAVLKCRSLNSNVYSCFLDASKAFDRVNHYALFDKLVKRGVPLYIVKILVCWYNVQNMYIRWNNTMSDSVSVSNGGILSPYLFCVYMDDLSKKLNNVNAGCFTGTALIINLVILAPSHVGLYMLLSVCSDYGLEHDIQFNSAKSNIMIFCCKKFKDIHVPSFELNDNILPRVNQCKYLGHVITDDLKDDNDIARQYKIIYAHGNALIRKFYMCSDHVKCTLFRSFCTSLYTCQLWCNYKSLSIRKVYVAYNNVFRLLCNEPRYCSVSYMFVTRGLPTCKMLIRKKVYSFIMCIAKSSNTILQSILNSDALYTSQMYQHWRSVLYLYHF